MTRISVRVFLGDFRDLDEDPWARNLSYRLVLLVIRLLVTHDEKQRPFLLEHPGSPVRQLYSCILSVLWGSEKETTFQLHRALNSLVPAWETNPD